MGLPTQPSKREPSREESDFRRLAGSTTEETGLPVEDAEVGFAVNYRQAAVPIEVSGLTEYQPNGSNLWFIHNWGIASMLRYLRDDLNSEPAERLRYLEEVMCTSPAETVVDYPDISDQRIVVPAVRPWPEEAPAQPARNPQSDTRASDQQAAVSVGHPSPTGPEMVTDFPDRVVKAAWRRQRGRCARCGRWLIWAHRDRDDIGGAWQPHHMDLVDGQGGDALANCVILCAGNANCHFYTGHGGIGWSQYAALDDSELLFLIDRQAALAHSHGSTSPRRSLLREVLGIRQPKKAKQRPAHSVDGSQTQEQD
jgi:hypothetical protein